MSQNNIIIGVYYTDKKDSQRDMFMPKNNRMYIRSWYKSITDLQLKGILLYDESSCDAEFIDKYTSDNIIFVPRNKKKYQSLINTYRYLDIYDYLFNHVYDNVLITDVSDVTFKKNPFKIIDSETLIVGSEQHRDGRIYISKNWFWSQRYFPVLYGEEYPFWDKDFLSSGIVGGSYQNMMMFLEQYHKEYHSKNVDNLYDPGHDMTIMNYVIHKYFDNKYKTGMPVHTVFKTYDIKNDNAYIVHK